LFAHAPEGLHDEITA
jgi:hypothetical protein